MADGVSNPPVPVDEPLNVVTVPPEVQAIIDIINENIATFITNRERMFSLFDSSVGVSAKSLIASNDWTILRDLWNVELSGAVSGLQSAVNQIQNLT